MELNYEQLIVTTLLSSGLVTGLFTLITKKVASPEAKNDLARLGNEFARQLLIDAKSEREELRLTITELESVLSNKSDKIERLNQMLEDKDIVIKQLEARLRTISIKIQHGEPITLRDIFGEKAPDNLYVTQDPVV
jgi:uncharacterized coiled-coil protein SlyX